MPEPTLEITGFSVVTVHRRQQRRWGPLPIPIDRRCDDPPAQAMGLECVSDRTATVFDAAMLDDRLDQFASLLAGY